MGYLVYELPTMQHATWKMKEWLKNVKHRLESMPDQHMPTGIPPGFDPVRGGYLLKRGGPNNAFRLIARQIPTQALGGLPVLVFVDIMQRTHRGYQKWSPSDYDSLIKEHRPDIETWAQEQVKESPPSLPPAPPEFLRPVLEPLSFPGMDSYIFESDTWTRAQQKLKTLGEKHSVYQGLNAIADDGSDDLGELKCHTCPPCHVYYVRLKEGNTFLLGLTSDRWPPQEREEMKKEIDETWERVCKLVLNPSCKEPALRRQTGSFSRLAVRAYPAYLLADEELYMRVPHDREVFLPLSTEEIGHLDQLLQGANLPCIIEGRAGSGKSTVLAYYTAQRLVQTIRGGEAGEVRLLFVTQSGPLLKTSKGLIGSLRDRLTAEFGHTGGCLTPHYKTFHAFALEQLPADRRERFVERSHQGGWIGFERFRDLLRGKGDDGLRDAFGRNSKTNAEAVWFAIRSYIKGFRINEMGEGENERGWITPEDYAEGEEVPRKDRQVSEDFYRQVWEHVWPWYKRLTVACPESKYQPQYWDDLDLAWEVLRHRCCDAPDYAVIVCDEVQDFTRVELAALLGSLTWLNYNLSGLRDLRLPVILAGDAHQTINPSCFRWARVRTDTRRALVRHVPYVRPPKVWTCELRHNYRNAHGIAVFCNVIQRLRQVALGHDGELQKPWQLPDVQAKQQVRRLIIRKGQVEDLAQRLQSMWLIAPEVADPKVETARSFWKGLGIELKKRLQNCDTPATVKGMEQEFVAVIGFGTAFAELGVKDFWSWRNAVEDAEVPEAQRFAVEYFLNRLYVAVSRARRQLWILETGEGWEAFWEPLSFYGGES